MSGELKALPAHVMAALQNEADAARLQLEAQGRASFVIVVAFEAAQGGVASSSSDGWRTGQVLAMADHLEAEAARLRGLARKTMAEGKS